MRPLKHSPKKIRLNGQYPYERVVPQRPIVVRKGNKVVRCFLYENMKECLGTRCFWPRVGICPTFNRIDAKIRKRNSRKKSNKNGKYIGNGWVKPGIWKGV